MTLLRTAVSSRGIAAGAMRLATGPFILLGLLACTPRPAVPGLEQRSVEPFAATPAPQGNQSNANPAPNGGSASPAPGPGPAPSARPGAEGSVQAAFVRIASELNDLLQDIDDLSPADQHLRALLNQLEPAFDARLNAVELEVHRVRHQPSLWQSAGKASLLSDARVLRDAAVQVKTEFGRRPWTDPMFAGVPTGDRDAYETRINRVSTKGTRIVDELSALP